MSSSVLEKHNLALHHLYYSKPLPLFDLTDLEKIVHSFDTIFTDAAFRKAVFPYADGAQGLLKMLSTIREDLIELLQQDAEKNPFRSYALQFADYIFTIPIAHTEIHQAQQVLSPLIWQTQRSVDDLSQVKETAEDEITSEIRPNNIVGKRYLSEARFLIPVGQPQPGVLVFSIKPDTKSADLAFTMSKKSQSQQSCGAFFGKQQYGIFTPRNGTSNFAAELRGMYPFLGNQTSSIPYSSMPEALRKQTDPLRLETVVVAQGTENYPLTETVLPILLQKYILRLGKGD